MNFPPRLRSVAHLIVLVSCVATTAAAQRRITPQSDSSYIASLSARHPCSGVKANWQAYDGAPAGHGACVLVAAALAEIRRGAGAKKDAPAALPDSFRRIINGVPAALADSVKRITVNGFKGDINLSSPDDFGWWDVGIEFTSRPLPLIVRFDRVERTSTIGWCLECNNR